MNDRNDPPRRIISVIGPHSGCGKSTLICHVLRHIPGLGCLKISPRAEWLVPPAGGRPPYRRDCDIVKRGVGDRSDPDTTRFLAAGAAQVEWLRYDPEEFGGRREGLNDPPAPLSCGARRPPRGAAATVGSPPPRREAAATTGTPRPPEAVIEDALARFPAGMPVITEGTAAVKYARPNAVILVMSPAPREMKPACEAVLSRVTDLMLDGPAEEAAAGVNARLCWLYPEFRPQFVWAAHLAREVLPAAFLDRLCGLVGSHDS